MKYDPLLEQIAQYVTSKKAFSQEAMSTARYCLADSIACAFLALAFPACTKLLGPLVPGTKVPKGSRVIGTKHVLDPVRAAFNNGALIRWLDFNDTWLAAEWGHPSDNLGAIFSLADYLSQNGRDISVKDVLRAMIQAHEIQGCLALQNSFNRIGFDHVILVKQASCAVSAALLGLSQEQIKAACSHAWIDTGPLRTYRHAPNTGSRKSWAAGDASARGLQLAWFVSQGEMGYPTALSAATWGFCDVLRKGQMLELPQPFGSYVMENVLFKISFPAEFHAQTAVEAAFALHKECTKRLKDIERIEIHTHESAIRIIDKTGPLKNPADRDHCMQYMVAIGLLFGHLTAEHYEDAFAKDPRIDALRKKMVCIENKAYTKDYLDPAKRSIANRLQIFYKNGSKSAPIPVEYPVGHRRRRKEGIPLLLEKFEAALKPYLKAQKLKKILTVFGDEEKLSSMPFYAFVKLFT